MLILQLEINIFKENFLEEEVLVTFFIVLNMILKIILSMKI